MTKQEFVDAVAAKAGISKSDAAKVVDAVLDTITATLSRGDSVTFTGFGKFSTSRRAARMGVNPRTGARVSIPATTVPKFSAGSRLKQAAYYSPLGGASIPPPPPDDAYSPLSRPPIETTSPRLLKDA